MKSESHPLKGRWKIVWMAMWDQDFVDEEVPGHVTFGDKGHGEFQFGYVYGVFSWSTKNDHVDAPWEGNDEMDRPRGGPETIIGKKSAENKEECHGGDT